MSGNEKGGEKMSRYIDADKLIADLEKWKRNPNNDDSSMDLVNHFQGIIQAEPTADVIPRDYYEAVVEELCRKHTEEIASMPSVVRCEDCKYWLSDKPIKNKWFQNGEIDQCKWRTDESPNADDFCSYGERRE